ncbi:hypothetical protein MesoLjLc_78090 [Mesorhizobium sp. L-8-10]|uniref:DUF1127 domain-containing protein n=1 Tax=Mesorhizobium sp. L-8-10 TaxID=2744523 RepID=UPI0019280220|nr:DUF1127 domain-containing protein [Mesorhizobium sp. L-8-10]BCH35879.1 hypothetical protein MesoLjLc_78090 [Mesorhizobium sp. L-8-10]
MPAITRTDPASAPPLRSFLRRLRLKRAASIISRWYDRHLQRCDLATLDERMLADIGRSPEEARRECGKPFWRK